MPELVSGQVIAGYEILKNVTAGGMASLYLGRRRGAAGFSKLVAIKVVHPHLAREDKFVRMFLDEARLAARIQHPAVVSVEELLEEQGTYLMVMEYIHGCSLFELIKRLAGERRRLSVELTAWIGATVADGLHAAHELRDNKNELLHVVHRDVSPQNILLSYSGHPKVIDFGIAKSRAQTDATKAGVLRGKIGYMSPEQANGQPLDRTTDVYALGVVLWECLTSRRLFRADNEILQLDMVRAPKVVPPDEYAPVPKALSEVVMDALRPNPKMRIQSAKAFRDRLLQACPEVAGVHSSDLAGLLETVMGDKIEETFPWDEMGASVERVIASDSFVEQHTVAAPAARFLSDDSVSLVAEETVEPIQFTLHPPEVTGPSSTVFIQPPPDESELPVMRAAPVAPPPVRALPVPVKRIMSLFSLIIVIVAFGLAGWLLWTEIVPQGWFEETEVEELQGPDTELPAGYSPENGTRNK